jgi:hypothetical protein
MADDEPKDGGEPDGDKHRCPCACGGDVLCDLASKELDADDLAVMALAAGLASVFLAPAPDWRSMLGLVLGAVGVVGGFLAQRAHGARQKAAVMGLAFGALGLTFWLIAHG